MEVTDVFVFEKMDKMDGGWCRLVFLFLGVLTGLVESCTVR